MRFCRFIVGCFSLMLGVQSTSGVRADLVLEMVTPVVWDVSASPDGLFDVLFTVRSNGQSNTRDELNSFSLALRIVPTEGAVGQLVWDSMRLPPDNSTFPSYDGNPVFTQSGDVTTFSVSNGEFLNGVPRNVAVTGIRTNLLAARFSSPMVGGVRAPISGRFLVYAVANQTTFFTAEFDEFKFANIPEGSDDPGELLSMDGVLVIPEPSSGALCLVAALSVLQVGRRRSTVVDQAAH